MRRCGAAAVQLVGTFSAYVGHACVLSIAVPYVCPVCRRIVLVCLQRGDEHRHHPAVESVWWRRAASWWRCGQLLYWWVGAY
jgi:hypothetical protein